MVIGPTCVQGAARTSLLDLHLVWRRLVLAVLVLGLAAGLAACGGGGSSSTDEDDDLSAVVDPSTVTAPCQRRLDVTVFVNPAVAATRYAEIEAELRALPGVVQVSLVDQQAAYDELARLFPDTPGLDTLLPANLPASFRITLDDPARASDVKLAAATIDGVGEVTTAADAGGVAPSIPC